MYCLELFSTKGFALGLTEKKKNTPSKGQAGQGPFKDRQNWNLAAFSFGFKDLFYALPQKNSMKSVADIMTNLEQLNFKTLPGCHANNFLNYFIFVLTQLARHMG